MPIWTIFINPVTYLFLVSFVSPAVVISSFTMCIIVNSREHISMKLNWSQWAKNFFQWTKSIHLWNYSTINELDYNYGTAICYVDTNKLSCTNYTNMWPDLPKRVLYTHSFKTHFSSPSVSCINAPTGYVFTTAESWTVCFHLGLFLKPVWRPRVLG